MLTKKELDAITKAVKKSIPQKVIFEDVGTGPEVYGCEPVFGAICPCCGLGLIEYQYEPYTRDYILTNDKETGAPVYKEVTDDPEDIFKACYVHHAYQGLNSYCNRCGQKLDWGDYPRIVHRPRK